MARVLYGVGTGQRICLVRIYIEMFVEPSRSTSPSMHLKGVWAIHHLYKAAQILVDPIDIPQTGLGLFGESAARRSAAQYKSARRRRAGGRGGERMMMMETMMKMRRTMTRHPAQIRADERRQAHQLPLRRATYGLDLGFLPR